MFRASPLDGVRHGFLGRRGGVSGDGYASLNVGLGSGDDRAAVAENRARAGHAVAPGAQLVTVYQVHSADCVTVTEPWDDAHRPHADAIVTDRPGLALGVLTADCAPVLLADRTAGVVGATHAGWKGAFAGVTDTTVAAMVALGAQPDRIVAAIGPCIAQVGYEVDEHFRHRFIAADPATDRFFIDARAGHARFDLEGYVAYRLAQAGVTRVELLGLDTYADADRFFSYRRSRQDGLSDTGRQIAIIAAG